MDKINTTKHATVFTVSTLFFATLFYTGQVSAVVISVFTDRASWESAVGNFSIETFDDSVLNDGLNVYSASGGNVSGGVFNDAVFEGGFVEDTAWSFAGPIRAFGGNWDLGPGSAGTGLEFVLHGASDSFGVIGRPDINNAYTGGFWGMVADTSFDTIQVISAGLGSENYSLDNLVYSKTQIPEPNSLLLFTLGLIGLFGLGRSMNKEKKRNMYF